MSPNDAPHDSKAEAGLLGSLLLAQDLKTTLQLAAVLRPRDFFHDENQCIAEAIFRRAGRHEVTDLITLGDELRHLGYNGSRCSPAYCAEILDAAFSVALVDHYARIVKEHARRRELIQVSMEAKDRALRLEAPDAIIAQARGRLIEIARDDVREAQSIREILIENAGTYEECWTGERRVTGLAFGIPALDLMTGGFQPADYVCLAAQTSVGKTAFALQVSYNVAKEGGRVLWFSIEMAREALVKRLIALEAGLDGMVLRGGLSSEHLSRAVTATGKLSGLPIVIDDTSLQDPTKMTAAALRHIEEAPVALVVVDYLQLMEGKGRSRYEQVTHLSRSVKAMLRELNVPGLVLSQLKRIQGEEPTNADLRDSGQIEQDSDAVLLLHVPSWDHPENLTCILSKQRNGPLGRIDLRYNRATGRIGGLFS